MAGALDKRGGGVGKSGIGEIGLETQLRFGELGKENLFRGNPAKFLGEVELRQSPDDPLRRVELPRFHAIAVIVLKLVMKVMVALAQGNDRH